jgi:outer membrane receptor protein involved in Fe transport
MGTLGIVDFRYEVPTNDLLPERSVHAEAGYKFSYKKINGGISLFYMHLGNIITRVKSEGQVISGYQVYQKENSEKAFLKGVETELNWKITGNWNLSGAIAYTYGQNLTKKEPLRRVPPLNGRMMTTYRQRKWFTSVEFLFASKQDRLAQGDKDDNRIPAGGTPGWEVINLYGGYKLSKLGFNAGFQNITNADYRTHGSGINGVGRGGWLSVTLQL